MTDEQAVVWRFMLFGAQHIRVTLSEIRRSFTAGESRSE
jgi:hypothetical protein